MAKSTKQHSVILKHVTNEEVEHHINVLGVKNTKKNRSSCGISGEFLDDISGAEKTTTKATKVKRGVHETHRNEIGGVDDVTEPELDIFDEIHLLTPAALLDTTTQFTGVDIYSFKTPKRSKQMSLLAMESSRKIRSTDKLATKENTDPHPPKTNKKAPKIQGEKTTSKENDGNDALKTPGKRKTPARNVDVKTPLRTSKRTKKYLVQEMQARQLEGSDSSEGSGSEEEEEEETLGASNASRPEGDTKQIALTSETELYFEAHKATQKLSTMTSDRTLARLKTSKISQDKMQDVLDDIEKKKTAAAKKGKGHTFDDSAKIEISRQLLIANHRRNFRKWMFYICNGYNILLYGLGSKRKLVHEFCEKILLEHDKVIVNGYFPSIIIKSILASICEVIDDVTVVNSNQQQVQLDAICRKYSDSDNVDHLFLIVHNIDGVNLRNVKAQNVLSQLAACPNVHIIATVDHINASLIWDQSKLSRYQWLWYDVTTYEAYRDETSFENSLLLLTTGTGVGGLLALSGLVHVTRSLTPNARGIFQVIADFQTEESKTNSVNYIGLSFSDLYQMCREKFLVNSELTLRTQLTEFLDHKLVQIRKGGDGGEYLSIPLDNATLQEYLDQIQ